MSARNLGVVFGRESRSFPLLSPFGDLALTQLISFLPTSYPHALGGSVSRVRRHGWKGSRDRLAGRERSGSFFSSSGLGGLV